MIKRAASITVIMLNNVVDGRRCCGFFAGSICSSQLPAAAVQVFIRITADGDWRSVLQLMHSSTGKVPLATPQIFR